MKAQKTKLPGVLLLRPRVFSDERGFFSESWNREVFNTAIGQVVDFVQDNRSCSVRSVLRGLHYQAEPMAQAKLVSVLRGTIFDVVVDLRPESPTKSRWMAEILSEERGQMLWIPEGFAHGFLVLSDFAEVIYKASRFYSPEHERCIRWDDGDLAISWPLEGEPIISAKDRMGKTLLEAMT
jgi:dTDP-4-dehydrorhamnose 3,5-epimerase